jgi:hypothetical protein
MNHSLHSRLSEYLSEVAITLLTVPRAIGTIAGNPTTRQLEIMTEAKGNSSTHGKGFDNDDIDTREDWGAS